MPLDPRSELGEFYEEMTETKPENLQVLQTSKGLIKRFKDRSIYSPDLMEFRHYEEIPVLLYGDVCKDGLHHNILDGANDYGFAHTISQNFIMKDSKFYPVVFDVANTNVFKHKIRGELYGVSPEHLITLDIHHQNTYMYKRVKRRALFEDCKPEGSKVYRDMGYDFVYMYLGVVSYWETEPLERKKVISYVNKPGIDKIPFYEHINWVGNDPYDEWGYNGYPPSQFGRGPHIG